MGTGEVLIIIGVIVIAFSSVTAVGAISGKIEGVITLSDKIRHHGILDDSIRYGMRIA